MITPSDVDWMKAMLDQAAGALEEPLTLLKYQGESPGDPAAGVPPAPDRPEVLLTGFVFNKTLQDEPETGGRVEQGMVVFQIRQTLLPAPPTDKDRIRWKGALYEPVKVTEGRLVGGLFWVIRGMRR